MGLDIEALIGQLSVAEKAALTSGSGPWHTGIAPGVPPIMVSDGPNGLRVLADTSSAIISASKPATCFPAAATLASSWDTALLREIGEALGQEAQAADLAVILGPGLNIKRSPLCGRNFEYYSEDPYLAGELAVSIVEGIQSQGVGTSVKHFAANNQETDRQRVDVLVTERTLREIYLPAFERVVKAAQPWTVMCSYNKINGVASSANRWLLTEVLRDEWGYQGVVVSDWGAVYDRIAALAAGLDLEMPPKLGYSPQLVEAAVEAGELPESVLDESVRRLLRLVDRALAGAQPAATFGIAAHHQLARRAAAESSVLLTNDGILPLPIETKVALIGEFARTPRFQGAGSSQVNPTRLDDALTAFQTGFGSVVFEPGFGLEPTEQDAELRVRAVAAAQDADVAVLVLGLPGPAESEGFDRTHLALPANQLQLLREVRQVNDRVVVVLVNGAVVELDEVAEQAAAIVECWLGGQAGGSAIFDVLTGAIDPAGRLAETIAHRLNDHPSTLNFPGDSSQVLYGEGLFVGYRGFDQLDRSVAFPFGHGLSYTTFVMDDLQVRVCGSVEAGDLAAQVSVRVRNDGDRRGAQVVQVYVRDPVAAVMRPVRELKGFAKVWLDPDAEAKVEIDLDQRAFAFWSQRTGGWVVEAGEFVIEVGSSSRDLPLTASITVAAPPIGAPLSAESSLAEWLADPQAGPVVQREVAELIGAETLPIVASMPMSALSHLGFPEVDRPLLDAYLQRFASQQ